MLSVRPFSMRTAGAATLACCLLVPTEAGADGVREFNVVAKKYEFTPSRFEVTQGETVRIVIKSADSKHGFGIKELDVKTEVPKTGDPVTLEFVATEAGEFEIKCTKWCGNGHKKMTGLLVVRPNAGSH